MQLWHLVLEVTPAIIKSRGHLSVPNAVGSKDLKPILPGHDASSFLSLANKPGHKAADMVAMAVHRPVMGEAGWASPMEAAAWGWRKRS